MIAAEAGTWIGLASTVVVVIGGIVVALIQVGRVGRVVRANSAGIERVETAVNHVEGEMGPDGTVQHRTLSQRIDEGFARNDADHQTLFQRLGMDEARIDAHDDRLDDLDREVGK